MAIDRKALVRRHNPVLRALAQPPLTVGNGELAFTADVTGLQTFAGEYQAPPLCTQSQWGWHTTPFSEEKPVCTREDIPLTQYASGGRSVGYATKKAPDRALEFDWLRENPHRLNLARIGFVFLSEEGARALPEDVTGVRQTLDLYTGVLRSRFSVFGVPCEVETCCHPHLDLIAVTLRSPLVSSGRAGVEVRFPYGAKDISASCWTAPERHRTQLYKQESGARVLRTLDGDCYEVGICSPGAEITQPAEHTLLLTPRGDTLAAAFHFAPSGVRTDVSAQESFAESARWWEHYWQTGGALDLHRSTDPRALELERRIVLSRYLMAAQCAGTMPPQETGLTCNSWFGKFHLEMHLWHAAHFHFWGHTELLERSMGWYLKSLDAARALARSQGYRGARWPKMVGPEASDSPSKIGAMLIWQQPHPIFFMEWCYQAHPGLETLQRYAPAVFETAEFMADFARLENDRYVLGPPLIPAQEEFEPETCQNPVYELEYWREGLEIALLWKERLGQPREEKWTDVAARLAVPAQRGGVYPPHEAFAGRFEDAACDHPSMLCAYGLLPGRRIDRAAMDRTLDRVLETWDFSSMWGWDFGVMAMTAARLGRPEDAVALLLKEAEKNIYEIDGHNRQADRADLPLYLPGNGSLLLAAAMMAAGFDGCETAHPGFPDEGWTVESEGLHPM